MSNVIRRWTEEEDRLLRHAVTASGGIGSRSWKDVAQDVPGRTHTQCLQRWNKVLRPGLLKGPWSEKEDRLLIGLVENALKVAGPVLQKQQKGLSLKSSSVDSTMSGMSTDSAASICTVDVTENGSIKDLSPAREINWGLVAENIPGRSIKQCRERWFSNLDPNINRNEWSQEEDMILMRTQFENGNCWAQIARMLPGRTEHAVKTRYRSIVRAKKREWSAAEDDLLRSQYRHHGKNWAKIAVAFKGSRTKNAVMTRVKFLEGMNSLPSRPVKRRRASKTIVDRDDPIFALAKETMSAVVVENLASSNGKQVNNNSNEPYHFYHQPNGGGGVALPAPPPLTMIENGIAEPQGDGKVTPSLNPLQEKAHAQHHPESISPHVDSFRTASIFNKDAMGSFFPGKAAQLGGSGGGGEGGGVRKPNSLMRRYSSTFSNSGLIELLSGSAGNAAGENETNFYGDQARAVKRQCVSSNSPVPPYFQSQQCGLAANAHHGPPAVGFLSSSSPFPTKGASNSNSRLVRRNSSTSSAFSVLLDSLQSSNTSGVSTTAPFDPTKALVSRLIRRASTATFLQSLE